MCCASCFLHRVFPLSTCAGSCYAGGTVAKCSGAAAGYAVQYQGILAVHRKGLANTCTPLETEVMLGLGSRGRTSLLGCRPLEHSRGRRVLPLNLAADSATYPEVMRYALHECIARALVLSASQLQEQYRRTCNKQCWKSHKTCQHTGLQCTYIASMWCQTLHVL